MFDRANIGADHQAGIYTREVTQRWRLLIFRQRGAVRVEINNRLNVYTCICTHTYMCIYIYIFYSIRLFGSNVEGIAVAASLFDLDTCGKRRYG